ncbi:MULTISPECIES: hypothetical protein [unclassified Leptolyngbya]|uniref:hypothetical protein n=1 Tax=unclassified Leptolyngbya TaxID=2650499 RepID=UPI0016882CCC|nr:MULTISPECIES: hypothetical protein [unclassified Leptolyngbya]MBD1914115.1 hypothetical protein [Leptolyngbya sp. FACHB-8]MBD2158732.1 hypothetical protein [Leptolyngbya sp. FACHB-16]
MADVLGLAPLTNQRFEHLLEDQMMEAYISNETIARCRAVLDALPARPESVMPWLPEGDRHQTTQLTLLPPDELADFRSRLQSSELMLVES